MAEPVEVWYSTATQKLNRHWAELVEEGPHFRVPIPRFGSSDYHRSRLSHQFRSKRRPSFRWFQQQVLEQFDNVQTEQHVTTGHDPTGPNHDR